jgi:hypothetical protein
MLLDKLTASYRFGGPSSDWILPLHSSVASIDQKKAFLRPPENIRKASFATYAGCFFPLNLQIAVVCMINLVCS